MGKIQVSGSLQPGLTDTPLDARARIATLDAVADIQMPYVGMVFYVTGTEKLYVVKSLKNKQIGAAIVANAAVDQYEELTSEQLIDAAAKAHTHSNKATLDKFGETDGKPTYDGTEIGGGSDVDESRLLPDSGPDDSWMHHSESMDLVTPADMTSMQSADWTLTAENVQENFSAKPWGLFNSGSYGFNIDGSGPATCTWTRRDGTPTLIDRLKIYTSSPGNNNGDSYEFYGSQDGNNWTLLGSWSAKWNSDSVKDTETNLNVLTLEVSNSTKYLYYKFSANSPTLDRLKGYGVTTKNEWKKFPVATASTAGLMAAADKTKLDGLDTIDIAESRLLPDPATVPAGFAGHPVVFDVQEQGGTGDANTLLLMHLDNDVVDYSKYAHSAVKTGDVAFQTGKFGQGLKFASASGGSYLQIPYSTAFNLASLSAWTFDVWVYLTQTPRYNAILVQRQASSPCSYQFCFSSGTCKPQLYNGSAYVATGSVELNTWTHVAFTYLNGTLKIWIGGQLDSTFTNVSLTDYDLPVKIGYHYSSTAEQFVGLLDELRLSSCDRTADQTDPMYSADGTSFTPPTKPYGVTSNRFKVSDQPSGTVNSVNGATPNSSGAVTIPAATALAAGLMAAADKAKLDGISTSEAWYTVADAAAITLNRANGELQKVELTQDCVLTAPTLDADNPTLLLQITSSTAVTVTVGATNIVTEHTGVFQVGWFWDGAATRRYPVVEVA